MNEFYNDYNVPILFGSSASFLFCQLSAPYSRLLHSYSFVEEFIIHNCFSYSKSVVDEKAHNELIPNIMPLRKSR